jgi:hypothetical protein
MRRTPFNIEQGERPCPAAGAELVSLARSDENKIAIGNA